MKPSLGGEECLVVRPSLLFCLFHQDVSIMQRETEPEWEQGILKKRRVVRLLLSDKKRIFSFFQYEQTTIKPFSANLGFLFITHLLLWAWYLPQKWGEGKEKFHLKFAPFGNILHWDQARQTKVR